MLCTICSNKVTILSYYTQIDKGPAIIGSKIVTRYDFFFFLGLAFGSCLYTLKLLGMIYVSPIKRSPESMRNTSF
ncbi:hypothetical protein HanRHA438_Chr11g0521061 [Helianthus annuus]|uniref:Uncharacterized protein n=1 Tax=Helianthus annuus TaxID=4232 RepID=A0A9K3HRT9_HELAN|nr:hypothetical protein HanXRQr2_Chr11g0508631 [Helianthus annuus]KAJ0511012.1 hypothetical protein HanIR_Chr11g0547171 [Helianthus annuus]KAJ0872202.1 hypothetical protein HanRHA438_Chr11g0521061 [Helianthus annuus]